MKEKSNNQNLQPGKDFDSIVSEFNAKQEIVGNEDEENFYSSLGNDHNELDEHKYNIQRI